MKHHLYKTIILVLLMLSMVLPVFSAKNSVLLYQNKNFGGKSIAIEKNVPDLRQSPWNFNDQASSIKLIGVSYVSVYEHVNYKGKCQTFDANRRDLTGSYIGDNNISSIKLFSRCPQRPSSIILCENKNFSGKSIEIKKNIPDLRQSPWNFNDQASSIKLMGVSFVSVYEHVNYKGKCQTFDANRRDLTGSYIGDNNISSVKLNFRCPQRVPMVILYEDKNYSGKSYNLKKSSSNFGHVTGKVSSLKLDGVSSVGVYSAKSYRGNCDVFTSSQPDLSKTSIGDNNIVSIKFNGSCVHSGPCAMLYENENYNGKHLRVTDHYTSALSDLSIANFDNKTSSIRIFNTKSLALYEDASWNGKCLTITSNTPSFAGSKMGDNKISSIRFNSRCDEEVRLVVRNKSAAVIKVRYEYGALKAVDKNLVSGQSIRYNFAPNVTLKVTIFVADIAPLESWATQWRSECEYAFDLKESWSIEVKGTLHNISCVRRRIVQVR